MAVNYINGKEKKKILEFIHSSLKEGQTKSEILDELSKEYRDKRTLNILIANTPKEELREKYKPLTIALVSSLYINGAIQILMAMLLWLGVKQISYLFILIPATMITPVFNYIFAKQIGKSYGGNFIPLCLFSFMGFLSGNTSNYIIERFASNGFDLIRYTSLVLVAFIVIGTFILKNKMFPYFGFLGPKQGSDSQFLFE